jgi:hypothetical protein
MQSYLKTSLAIFCALAVSRFIPHPPNFTSLIALSLYVPAILGIGFLPIVILSFAVTDVFIGFHNTLLFTWGSIIAIGFASQFFAKSMMNRIVGSLFGASLFFVITNFGVWSLGTYGYTLEGFILCYTLAIPFFGYTIVSTILFSSMIEGILKLNFIKSLKFKNS